MRFHAKEEVFGGQQVIVLADREHDSFAVVAPSIGFNMIRCRLGGIETIEGPPDLQTLAARSSEFGVPLLWPPGRIAGGRFSFGGKTYAYPLHEGTSHLHGEIRMRPWRIIALEAREATGASVTAELRFESPAQDTDNGAVGYYPHDVALTVKWTLDGRQIRAELEAVNLGTEDVPFGFGLHPYFAIPGRSDEVEFRIPVEAQYEADPDGLNRNLPVYTDLCKQVSQGISLDQLPEDKDHFVFRMEKDARCARIVRRTDKVSLHFEFDSGLPYLVVFKPKWANALSLEPWSCLSDAYNSPLPPELTGASSLKAGERRRMQWSWAADTDGRS